MKPVIPAKSAVPESDAFGAREGLEVPKSYLFGDKAQKDSFSETNREAKRNTKPKQRNKETTM